MTQSTNQPINQFTHHYPTSPRLKFMVAAGAVLMLLCGWELVRFQGSLRSDFSWGFLLFFVIALAVTLWYLREMLSRVSLTDDAVVVEPPFGATRTVAFRQLVSVSETGRMGGHTITLIYYPLRADGLVDHHGAAGLILPEVDDHDGLLAALEAQVAA